VDECTLGTDNCDTNAECTNADGGFTCACETGFTGDGVTCVDDNECATNNGGCEQVCTNTPGSFTCSCDAGFEVNATDDSQCDDVNECNTNNGDCPNGSQCVNRNGSYFCNCLGSYVWNEDTNTCDDYDECTLEVDNCDPDRATCQNEAGGFTCACNANTVDENGDGTLCTLENGQACATNDECNSDICAADNICDAVDECLTDNGGCDANATCTNNSDGVTCACNGNRIDENGDGTLCTLPAGEACTTNEECNSDLCVDNVCDDVDECTAGTDNCDANATCTNTAQGFSCTCDANTVDENGDGTLCTFIAGEACTTNEECNSDLCVDNVCDDVDECATNNGGCDPDRGTSTCTNTAQSFSCTCDANTVDVNGDGTSCPLVVGQACTAGTDCLSGTCGTTPPNQGTCLGATGEACANNNDCASDSCTSNTCD